MKVKYYSLIFVLICIFVFILQYLFIGFTDLFVLDNRAFIEVWRFLTSIFLHGGFAHLLSNMVALALFGTILESVIGSKRFLILFLVTGILANVVSVFIYSSSLGASGAIFGVLGVLIVLRPFMLVWAAGLPMPMFVAGIFWALLDLMGIFDQNSNIANIAHLTGMFFGVIFGVFLRVKNEGEERKGKIRFNEGLVRRWEDYYMK